MPHPPRQPPQGTGAADAAARRPPWPRPPLSRNALLDTALEQRRHIAARLRDLPREIAQAQAQLGQLLHEKSQLQQRRRRAEALIAFASAPKLLPQDRCCPLCYIDHGNKVRLTAVPASTPLGQYRCVICAAVYVLAPERPAGA